MVRYLVLLELVSGTVLLMPETLSASPDRDRAQKSDCIRQEDSHEHQQDTTLCLNYIPADANFQWFVVVSEISNDFLDSVTPASAVSSSRVLFPRATIGILAEIWESDWKSG